MVCYIAPGLSITAYANADYAGDPNDCRSTGGILNFPGFKETKRDLPLCTEVEYRQLAYTATILSWFRNLFHDLHLYLP